ncbi:hypothetical protein CRENBAI_011165, partial [Crenichthys baileyi]
SRLFSRSSVLSPGFLLAHWSYNYTEYDRRTQPYGPSKDDVNWTQNWGRTVPRLLAPPHRSQLAVAVNRSGKPDYGLARELHRGSEPPQFHRWPPDWDLRSFFSPLSRPPDHLLLKRLLQDELCRDYIRLHRRPSDHLLSCRRPQGQQIRLGRPPRLRQGSHGPPGSPP